MSTPKTARPRRTAAKASASVSPAEMLKTGIDRMLDDVPGAARMLLARTAKDMGWAPPVPPAPSAPPVPGKASPEVAKVLKENNFGGYKSDVVKLMAALTGDASLLALADGDEDGDTSKVAVGHVVRVRDDGDYRGDPVVLVTRENDDEPYGTTADGVENPRYFSTSNLGRVSLEEAEELVRGLMVNNRAALRKAVMLAAAELE